MWQLHTRRCNLHVNVFTSSFIERDRVPVVAESDRQALELALEIAKVRDPEKARIVRIRETNTLGVSSTFRKGCGTKRSPTSAFGSSTKGNGRFKTVSCPRRLRPSPSVKFPQRRSLNRLKVARKSDKCPIDGRGKAGYNCQCKMLWLAKPFSTTYCGHKSGADGWREVR
ncbi:hypothetical protein M2350_000481 [Candidatus Fervidibacter sacchari]|uniref:Uncharacterized protein n=1 Tax=Candidatus Fervidibacter sacchari TaxID=1448929 RepID=A0ABT2EK77_9BACT|nr:hypothetical protein [Candidatus Fervidibacter sacchari]